MSEVAIQVCHLNKSYGPLKAVDDLDFQVKKAECFGLLGPNGAGKSTTMKIIYGKANPDPDFNTVIDIFGCHPGRSALKIKSFAGIVPQQDNLDSELSVSDNLYVYSRFYGIERKEARVRINELLEFMELQEKAGARIGELSGGMQRRLIIARALLNKPQLLILDEPTTGLDPQVRHLIWNKLRELKESGVTILLSTHYMDEAFQICDNIIIMDKGRKILQGNPRELLPAHLESFVMEVHGMSREAWASSGTSTDHIRYEYYQDTLFVYSQDSDRLSELAEGMNINDYHIRQANLEDLFLKVTGRGLNELQ